MRDARHAGEQIRLLTLAVAAISTEIAAARMFQLSMTLGTDTNHV